MVVERHAKPRARVAGEGARVAERGRRGGKGMEVAEGRVEEPPLEGLG